MELRLRGDCGSSSVTCGVWLRSRTAPAVLGREPFLLFGSGELTPLVGVSRPAVGVLVTETIEETLPDTEWPGRTVAVLPVSVDTIDRGRGMNSRVSEKPTRARGPQNNPVFESGEAVTDTVGVVGGIAGGVATGSGSALGVDLTSGNVPGLRSKSAGLVGALLPREPGLGGLSISDRSWLEIAAERRCAWPLLEGGGLTGANVGEGMLPSDLVGLVLITVMASPALTFPPTNSLPNLR